MKRYDLEHVRGYTEYREMRPDPDGDWVHFDDVEAAQKQGTENALAEIDREVAKAVAPLVEALRQVLDATRRLKSLSAVEHTACAALQKAGVRDE